MEERLQKILSSVGVCSRREGERYLLAGRVKVNGQVATLGQQADLDRDEILVDGKPLKGKPKQLYLLLNKPKGYVTTLSDEQGRRTVAQLVADCGDRVWPVGRLDLNSEGLLLLTNDGAFTHKLLHPSHEVEKEYRVMVRGDVAAALPILRGPMSLDGVPLAPAEVTERSSQVLHVTIHEGRNRQVRRMCQLAGLEVVNLRRVREGNLELGSLPIGKWRHLTPDEVASLLPDRT